MPISSKILRERSRQGLKSARPYVSSLFRIDDVGLMAALGHEYPSNGSVAACTARIFDASLLATGVETSTVVPTHRRASRAVA